MAAPYIPARDADFKDWLDNFSTLINANPTTYGLTSGDAAAIGSVRTAFDSAYALAVNPATRTSATVASKDAARATAEATCRPFAIRVRNNPAVSNALKVGLGLTIPNTTPTPIPAPTIAPSLELVNAIALQQTIGYKNPVTLGKGKPFGAIAVEIWRAIGTTPAIDPDQATFNAIVTKSPFRSTFAGDQQGKVCTYFARFRTRSGPEGQSQTGPWSSPLIAFII
jgi:hypothetical protein